MASTRETVGVEDARKEIASSRAIAVDVRTNEEWNEGHVPGAIHLPDADATAGSKELEEGARLMVIAQDAEAALRAAGRLSEQGYDAVAVDGDMEEWVSEDFNVQPTPDADEDTEFGLK